jgi:hypothetical protein
LKEKSDEVGKKKQKKGLKEMRSTVAEAELEIQ